MISILCLFFLISPITAVITVPPVSVTVPPFTTATFNCEGIGDILNWLVESAELTDFIKQQREISVTTTNTSNTIFSSVLTVKALPINNDLGIGCEVITYDPFEHVILGSALTIRGVSPVVNLQYNFYLNNLLLITWSPPAYYSNDIPVGSSVSYHVLVTDEAGDIILDETTTNTNIAALNVTECDTLNISVTALVDQYNSMKSKRNNGSYSVTVIQDSIHIVSIEVSSLPSPYCEKKLFVKDESDGSILVNDEILRDDYKNIILKPYKEYLLVTEVKNLRDKVKDAKYTIISTYNVQDVLVSTEGNGSVILQCIYLPESTADGCHVVFTDTSNGRNESFDITGSDNSVLVTLSASGEYTVTVFDIVNGSLYGPAVQDTILVEIPEVIPPISTSFTSESTTASTQYTVANTINPTVTDAPEINVSPTSVPIMTVILLIVAGIPGGIVLVILIILAVCVVTVYKRKRMKVQVLIRSEIATVQQPQAETNHYQDLHELRNEVPITTSPVIVTSGRLINEENPYHVTKSQFLHHSKNTPEGLMQQLEQHPSLKSMTTQETNFEDGISSTTNNNEYTIDPAVTVNVSNDANTDIVAAPTYASIAKRTGTTPNNSHDVYTDDAITFAVTDNTAATVAPTYAVVAKRTDTTPLPAVDQHVVYSSDTGDINKSGDGLSDTNNIVTGGLNLTTSEDGVAADLSDSPTSYNDSDTTSDPVIECSAESPQASPNDYICSESEEESYTKGASNLCVTPPVEQPKDDNTAATFQFRQHSAKPHQYKS